MMKTHTFWMMVCATALLHVAVASATHPALPLPTWGRNATIRFGVSLDMYQFNHNSSQAMVRFPVLLENVPGLKDYHMALPGYGMLSVMWDCAKNETRIMFEDPGSPQNTSACYRAPLHPESKDLKALCPLDEDAFKYFARLVYWHDGDDDDIAPMPMFNGTVASFEDRSLMNFWTFPTMHGDAYSPTLQYWQNATTSQPVAVSFSSAQQEALALYVTEFSNVTTMNTSMPCFRKNPGFPRDYGAGHLNHNNATGLVSSVAELIGNLFQRISGVKQTQ